MPDNPNRDRLVGRLRVGRDLFVKRLGKEERHLQALPDLLAARRTVAGLDLRPDVMTVLTDSQDALLALERSRVLR